MNSVFTHHGVKWTQQKIAANPRVGAGMSHLALKFGPELGGNGRVRPRLLDVEVDLCDLTPMAERPIFLNEGAVQSYLWGCEKALSWLANGKEAIAYWEPSYPIGDKRSDFIIETDDCVRLIELEKDGKHNARKDLAAQVAAARASGYLGNALNGKRVQLVGLDVRPTLFHDVASAAGCEAVPLVWGLCTHAKDPNSLWIVLYPKGVQPAALTTKGEQYQIHTKLSDADTPYRVLVYETQVLDPSHGATAPLRRATVMHFVLYGARARKIHPGAINTAGRSNSTSGWVAEIAQECWGKLQSDGASFWESRDITAIAPNEGFIYFFDRTPADVVETIRSQFHEPRRWPVPRTLQPG
jgi:hypothetical protein